MVIIIVDNNAAEVIRLSDYLREIYPNAEIIPETNDLRQHTFSHWQELFTYISTIPTDIAILCIDLILGGKDYQDLMRGLEACKTVRSLKPSWTIVAFTHFAERIQMDRAFSQVLNGLIDKGKIDSLLDRQARVNYIRKIIGAAQTNQETSLNQKAVRANREAHVDTVKPDKSRLVELAHVLFMDIVGYSKVSNDQQTRLRQRLKIIVRGTNEFRRAQLSNELISRSTGDGMALVFFGSPLAPVRCALEISRALQSYPEIKLRMGAHTGPVYRDADINDQIDVAGSGINMAQRVMDCGEAGHILLSKNVADVLLQLDDWAKHVYELGEVEVKHRIRVHISNLRTSDLGNPSVPEKLRSGQGSKHDLKSALVGVAALLVVGIIIAAVWYKFKSVDIAPPRQGNSVASTTSAERALSYWFTVQKMRDDKPYQERFTSSGQEIFESGWQFWMGVYSQQSGYLYILSEAPDMENGRPRYYVLFPLESGSALLEPKQQLEIPPPTGPGFFFGKTKGTEKLWMVWSAQPVPVLEGVKGLANSKDKGIISDPPQINEVRDFLEQHKTLAALIEKDPSRERTNVSGKGDVLVNLLELKHR